MKRLRFTVGRWLIHAGLAVMPKGRVRTELWQLLEDWADGARAGVALGEFDPENLRS